MHCGPPSIGADYQVTGTIDPDVTGYYFEAGEHNGQPYYDHDPAPGCIWWQSAPPMWILSDAVGSKVAYYWFKSGVIEGEYAVGLNCTGTATVACVNGCGEDVDAPQDARYNAWAAANPAAALWNKPFRDGYIAGDVDLEMLWKDRPPWPPSSPEV